MSAPPAPVDALAEWTLVLDQLERDVVGVEQVLAGDDQAVAPGEAGRWEAPRTSGPIPEGLVERARRIADRQVAAQAALVERMRTARKQTAVVRRLDTRVSRPAYVDTRA